MKRGDLQTLARQWRRRILWREILCLAGISALVAAAFVPWVGVPSVWPGLVLLGLGLTYRLRMLRPWRVGPLAVAAHLDRVHPELEESSVLFLRSPDSLQPLERFQLRRLERSWASLSQPAGPGDPGRAPRGFWRVATATFAVGIVALAGALAWRAASPRGAVPNRAQTVGTEVNQKVETPSAAPPKLGVTDLEIIPPAYTVSPSRTIPGLDAEVEEGATVSWQLRLVGPGASEVRLILGEGGGVRLTENRTETGSTWSGSRVMGSASGVYHIVVRSAGGTEVTLPEVGFLKVIPDGPPAVAILEPTKGRTELEPPVSEGVTVAVEVTDDYGVANARLVATVARGSGEAVKFRERSLELTPQPGESPRARRFTATLDLSELGMEPGDELYFHVEAEDNYPSTPHRVRSETRFIAVRGPESRPVNAGRGVSGVNLVPEYFRSERQIILDTEKLVADRSALSEREFRRRSDDLGQDQALLRLRYGQFVGEESEAGAGGGGDHVETNLNALRPGMPSAPSGGTTANGDPRAGLRTAMRLKLEHADQARGAGGHDGGPNTPDAGLPPTADQILAPFVDQHDSQDKATFYDGETRASLRGVLAEMWTAEALLRTARPEEALAPEHRALDGLKEIQQGERLYVQRVGFEPTPLRMTERRGKGDLTDVPKQGVFQDTTPVEPAGLAAARRALVTLPAGLTSGRALTGGEREVLRETTGSLVAAATQQGGVFIEGVRASERLESGAEPAMAPKDLAAVRSALFRLLPRSEEHPTRRELSGKPVPPGGVDGQKPTGGEPKP